MERRTERESVRGLIEQRLFSLVAQGDLIERLLLPIDRPSGMNTMLGEEKETQTERERERLGLSCVQGKQNTGERKQKEKGADYRKKDNR